MSNSKDKKKLNEEQSLTKWVKVIEENRKKVLAHVKMITAETHMDMEVDEDKMKQIITTNPVVEDLMKIAKEDFGMWTEALVLSKAHLARLFSHYSRPLDHSVLSVSYGVDHDLSHEVLQILGVIQEFEAQSVKVMDGWINNHLHREQLKGELLSIPAVHPELLVNSDLYAAFLLLDQKMVSEIKSDLSDLLNNHSVLIDVLVAATAHMHDDGDSDTAVNNMYM